MKTPSPPTSPHDTFSRFPWIARRLSPFDPDTAAFAASRLMIERMRELIEAGASFSFETTCAGIGHSRLVRDCKNAGYRVTLLFLWLPSPELAVARVANRVRLGGHRIPVEAIVRRYWVGLRNMRRLYLPLVDLGLVYDNSDVGRVLIAESSSAGILLYDRARLGADRGGCKMSETSSDRMKAAFLRGLKDVQARFAKNPRQTDGSVRAEREALLDARLRAARSQSPRANRK
jgi:predicted ABC-type ATPase